MERNKIWCPTRIDTCGPLRFNIFINDIFLFIENTKITNYADDNTPYAIESNINNLIESLEKTLRFCLHGSK